MDILNRILNFDKLQQIYSKNDISIKSVLQNLNRWESLSSQQKYYYENLTPLDSFVNGHSEEFLKQMKSEQPNPLSYGEITQKGVEQLNNYINRNIGVESEDIFYDIGSGNGKLILHMSLISNFKKFIGVEIDSIRHEYATKTMQDIGEFENVELINDDVLKLDLSTANVVFMNDTLFPIELINGIFSKLSKGTHVISLEEIDRNPISTIDLQVSWLDMIPVTYKHYII